MRMAAPKLIIKADAPVRRRVLLVSGILLLGAAGYGLFEVGRYKGGFNVIEARSQRTALVSRVAELNKQTADLRQQVALLETSRTIDSEAYLLVDRNLAELQAKIQQQEEDLAFYRGIVSPADNVSGLRIQDFAVTQGRQESLFRLKLVLVQAIKHDRRVSGIVNLTVDGALNGEPMSFGLPDLVSSEDGGGELAYSFRYFQDFEREVMLPEGFTPDRVNIEVRPSRRSARTIRQSYDWTVKRS